LPIYGAQYALLSPQQTQARSGPDIAAEKTFTKARLIESRNTIGVIGNKVVWYETRLRGFAYANFYLLYVDYLLILLCTLSFYNRS